MASAQRLLQSFGSGNDFSLYMFKDDIEMFRHFECGSSGRLRGLWTNTWNPVVHVVDYKEVFPEPPYKAIQSPEWKDEDRRKVVTTVGHWYFINEDEVPDIKEDQEQHLIHLVVTEKNSIVNFHPVRWHDGKSTGIGQIKRLPSENPFRLDQRDEYRKNQVDSDIEKKGNVAKLRDLFETMLKLGDTGKKQNQWYQLLEGQEVLRYIEKTIEDETGNTVEIKRDEETRDIFLKFLFNNNEAVLAFPNDFPQRPATLYKRLRDNSVKEINNIPISNFIPELFTNLHFSF